jgi:hypothetical protein
VNDEHGNVGTAWISFSLESMVRISFQANLLFCLVEYVVNPLLDSRPNIFRTRYL